MGVQISKHVRTASPVGQHLRAASAGKLRPMKSGPAGSRSRSLQRRVQEALGQADRAGCRPVEEANFAAMVRASVTRTVRAAVEPRGRAAFGG